MAVAFNPADSSIGPRQLVLELEYLYTFFAVENVDWGLSALRKPFLHLHTQFNRDLPWSEIAMDLTNLNQAAHGDREAGFIHTPLRLNRKVVVGHWSHEQVQDRSAASPSNTISRLS
jgi:L-arabinose isomerase